jgi:hypothetical protein
VNPPLAPADRLEPEVVDMANQLQLHLKRGGKVDAVSSIAPAIYSAAISLRRIADALSTGDGPSWLGQLEGLAWQCGQAFERGRGAS